MKTFLHSAVVVALLAGVALPAQASELVIASPGGSFLDQIVACKAEPFKKATGVDTIVVANSSVQTAAKLRATKGAPEFDIIYVDSEVAVPLAKEGLLDKIDYSKLKNKDAVNPRFFDKDGHFITMMTASTTIAYNPALTEKPTSWADVLDPKYKGKVALPDITGTAGLHFLLAVNKLKGGTLDNVDPGFEAIKAMKGNVVMFYTQADQLVALFQRGEIAIAPWYPDRVGSAADAGVPVAVAYPKEGAIGIRPVIAIAANAANKELAQQYIDMELSEASQKCFADTKYAGPVNKNVILSEKAEKILPNAEDVSRLWYIDLDLIASKRAEWTARWQREIAQ